MPDCDRDKELGETQNSIRQSKGMNRERREAKFSVNIKKQRKSKTKEGKCEWSLRTWVWQTIERRRGVYRISKSRKRKKRN